jgi:2-haloacid dehalogenase
MASIKNIVFDLGGVLIDWNPRHLFTEVFENQDELEYFLEHVCNSDWNEEQDGGRSLEEGTNILLNKHPKYRREIQMFYGQWERMLGGEIVPNVSILRKLTRTSTFEIFALTNWSAETFPIAQKRYEFLDLFKGIVVSGVEFMRKPDLAFYQLMLDRFSISAPETLFIDDNERNILAAKKLNLKTIHLPPGENLQDALRLLGIEV